MTRLLVVAATEPELAGATGVATLACGVGPVEAAARTAGRLAREPVDALLHAGLAGARRLDPRAVVVGTEAVYEDLRAAIPVVDRVRPDGALVAAARDALPGSVAAPIGTTARVGGTTGCDVEAMEGFAVLRAAELAGVPAVEVRVVANAVDEPDRGKWRLAEALAELERVVAVLVPALCH